MTNKTANIAVIELRRELYATLISGSTVLFLPLIMVPYHKYIELRLFCSMR